MLQPIAWWAPQRSTAPDICLRVYGTDKFAFDAASAFNAVDSIQQFNTADNDNIDISDVLDGHYTSGVDVLTDFVQIQTNGSNSELYVDTSGSATFGSTQHSDYRRRHRTDRRSGPRDRRNALGNLN
ncbi:hypothetical protein ACVWWO_006418 [Bradyrhizobium sp. F1.13.1]